MINCYAIGYSWALNCFTVCGTFDPSNAILKKYSRLLICHTIGVPARRKLLCCAAPSGAALLYSRSTLASLTTILYRELQVLNC